jgi:hypothetical protein
MRSYPGAARNQSNTPRTHLEDGFVTSSRTMPAFPKLRQQSEERVASPQDCSGAP